MSCLLTHHSGEWNPDGADERHDVKKLQLVTHEQSLDADPTGHLDISGETRTAKHYAINFQAREQHSVERAAPPHRFHRSAVHRQKRKTDLTKKVVREITR